MKREYEDERWKRRTGRRGEEEVEVRKRKKDKRKKRGGEDMRKECGRKEEQSS